MTKEEFKAAIEQAHMAGQRDAGVDPSYHSALAWFQSEIQKPVNENEDLAFVSGISWTDSDIDAAYLMGVMNAGSFDDLNRELKRLKDMGLKPHEAVAKVRCK